MTITDSVTLIVSLFFLARGASRGLMHSLAGPFSIIIATILSILYYQATKNIVASLIIGLAGPFLLTLIFKFLIKTWAVATNSDIKKPAFLSRLLGAALTLAWGWVFIVFALILLTVLPAWGQKWEAVHNDVIRSVSYSFAKPLEDTFFAAAKQNTPAVPGASPANDVKSLAEDPRFQKILQDPDIQQDINAHDIAKLMSNPKMMDLVRQIMNDPATMNKVLSLYKSQAQAQPVKNH